MKSFFLTRIVFRVPPPQSIHILPPPPPLPSLSLPLSRCCLVLYPPSLPPSLPPYPCMIPWFHQQLVHVRNGCISDHLTHLPYVKVGKTNFHNTGHHLDHYQSLRGTSKVEAVHSVLDRTFYGTHGLCTEVFDARLGWWLLGYNRR